ncbi:MAG TPA: nitrilase-related carbon-nitrogen hydrolase [Gaiellaceae bacterium]|nr:nitrilase-related carbon-nitrogen hydrolase [Gaiellaceae bacterium]
MRIALAQLDSRLGDLAGNAERARAAVAEAGADLVVFPELFLSGYALAAAETDTAMTPAEAAAAAGPGTVLLGFHERDDGVSYNSAVLAVDGEPVYVQRKLYLVDYPPFDEHRRFAPGSELRVVDGRAVLICNDAWQPMLPSLAVLDGARILLMPSCSSTAVAEAEEYWRAMTVFYARLLRCFVVFVNRVGAEAGFTFWGGSHVVDPTGTVVAEAPRLEEALVTADLDLGLVDERRRALPPAADERLDLLRRELDRLARKRAPAEL